MINLRFYSNEDVIESRLSIPSLRPCIIAEKVKLVDKPKDQDTRIDSGLVSMGDVRLEDLSSHVEESPYDTESKIKVIKRFQPTQLDDED
ncbi:hypothetical protein Tco_0480481 [Tanacetum coccineum]